MSGTRQGATKASVTAEMALEMLQSALGYLQRAGMTVEAQNDGALRLTIPGARVVYADDGSTMAFYLGEACPRPKSRL